MSFAGGCLCGDIRYEIASKYLNAMNCYCEMCRKAHGGAFSTHIVVRPEQLSWPQGKHLLTPYQSSATGLREFCPSCGTHLLVHGQSGDGALGIPAGTVDGKPDLTLIGHMYTAELVPWHHITDDRPQHAGWPPGYGPN